MATYERLDYGSPDGSNWGGTSTDALGFYGKTPVVQQNIGLGLSTASHASTLVSSIAEALKTIGIVYGA
jgi:hypothetical protein